MGLDYCRLDLLPWLFATTSSLGPLPLDQWGYLLRLFQGDFHSRQGIKQTADSPVPMMACLFTLCHAPNVTHILCEQVAHKRNVADKNRGGPSNLLPSAKQRKLPHFKKNKISKRGAKAFRLIFSQIAMLPTRKLSLLNSPFLDTPQKFHLCAPRVAHKHFVLSIKPNCSSD